MVRIERGDNMINIYKGDALLTMERLIEEGVQLNHIITDPPYNIARPNNFETMGRSRYNSIRGRV